MTTRCFSRLVLGIAALALIAMLLFSASKTSAGGGRSGPTAPSNLVATAVTTTTVSLSWSPSTAKTSKFWYKVRITNLKNSAYNALATVSQTQTTYTATYLAPNSPYTFSVYAVDEKGSKSSDSNVVSASTLPDTTPPTTPVLEASVLGPSQVMLIWTESTDNVTSNCCGYSVNMNGSPFTGHLNWEVAPTGKKSVIIRHLPPASTNSFSISAFDYSAGNVATSNTVVTTTEPSSDTIPPTVPTNVHLVRDDGCGEVWVGWTEATDETDSQDAIEYEIYVNGVLSPLPVAVGVDFDFVYGADSGDNFFTVKAVDRSGNTSEASVPLKLFLWRC